MSAAFLLATAISVLLLVALGIGDPKRRRTADLPGAPHRTATRRILAMASLLPGVALALTGDAAAFLMWLGAVALAGWALVQCLHAGRSPAPRKARR